MKLQIDIKKIIKLLAKDIYDSPYALLRENLQNAYDAILMRKSLDPEFSNPQIDIIIEGKTVTIKDNGIGMTYDNVENNYWKAGASGKNNDAARKAGVVGTFGIGAMANFGVCENLEVKTRHYLSEETITTSLFWEDLTYSDDCIKTNVIKDSNLPIGTTVIASIRKDVNLDASASLDYLLPYVQYLNIPVFLNGKKVSGKNYVSALMFTESNVINDTITINKPEFSYSIYYRFLNYNNGLICAHITNISYHNTTIKGDMMIVQDHGILFGLRNGFGLAPIPVTSNYRWGGIANLENITPTAGRDSVIRESIDFIANLIRDIETNITVKYSHNPICDNNTEFLDYIFNIIPVSFDCYANITINRQPIDDRFPLGHVEKMIGDKEVRYYQGNDPTIISQFGNENCFLLVLSPNRVRRTIQKRYLEYKGIQPVPDEVFAKPINFVELSSAEVAIVMRVQYILENDYLLNNVTVCFASITHNQPNKVEKVNDNVNIYLSKASSSITNIVTVYKEDYSLFDGFVKDYVRQHLYSKISPFVPSATKEGADALMRILKQKKDLFSIEEREIGELDEVIKDYLQGKASMKDVHRASSTAINSQKQTLSDFNIGNVKDVVPSVCKYESEDNMPNSSEEGLIALPPILNFGLQSDLKLLIADEAYSGLNNHKMFLALSERLYERYSDFFFEPHTTKVIWSTHKVVYVFTHISNQLSLYYDIDLMDALPGEATGGHPIISTTIITKNKIYVPIIPEMNEYFSSIRNKGKLEFYVRFDTMSVD